MTAEALSPPNPMQSLRERLIQEGSITPNENSESLFECPSTNLLSEAHRKLLKQIEELLEKVDCISEIQKPARRYRSDFYSIFSTPIFNFGIFNFLNILNIHRKLKNLIKESIFRKNSSGVVLARTGFFFSFKENMRNTP